MCPMRVPTSYFVCKGCELQIGIPTDTLLQPSANPDHRPMSTLRVVIQCPRCKTLSNFLQADYPGQEESNTEHGWAVVTWLECGVENCKSFVPVFAQKNAATSPEQDSAPGATTSIPALFCRDFHPVAEEKIRSLLPHLS